MLANIQVPRRAAPANSQRPSLLGLQIAGGVAAIIVPGCMGMGLPIVFNQLLALAVLWIVCRLAMVSASKYRLATLVVTLAVFAAFAIPELAKEAQLRKQYPFVSMEQRIPPPRVAERTHFLAAESDHNLQVTDEIDEDLKLYSSERREEALKRLHEDAVSYFSNTMGFGVGRMGVLKRNGNLDSNHPDKSIPQPTLPSTSAGIDGDAQVINGKHEDLRSLHLQSIFDFAHPRTLGYVKNRNAVAGFESHRFGRLPDNPKSWKVLSVELVGLVVNPQPVAYVSANLPRMEELKAASTRPLNDFESAGLDVLRSGQDLYVTGNQHSIRLLGAIRAAEKCAVCHGCDRGDMLGAFSYTLRRED
ncbi:MAG: hypothetical protein ACJ8C4_14520 [Gemmataceae bacterium]